MIRWPVGAGPLQVPSSGVPRCMQGSCVGYNLPTPAAPNAVALPITPTPTILPEQRFEARWSVRS